MNFRKADAHLPDYVFTHDFDRFYVYTIAVFIDPKELLMCLKQFLPLIGEDTFSLKHNGEYRTGMTGAYEEKIYFPTFERTFYAQESVEEMLAKTLITGPQNPFPTSYFEIGHDAIIESDTGKWAIHYERPTDLALIAVQADCVDAFESIFLENEYFQEERIEDLSETKNWAFVEPQFQQFLENYFPEERDKYPSPPEEPRSRCGLLRFFFG